MEPVEGRWCPGCGRPAGVGCDGCLDELDTPRFCTRCGRRLAVRVAPAAWTASCPRHGELA